MFPAGIPERIDLSVVESIKQNLPWLLPVALPICFFAISVGFKFLFGQRNFHFLGGDTAFTGCAVVSGTALRQIYYSKLTEPGENVRSRTPSCNWMLGDGASPKTRPLDLCDVHWHGLILLVCILVVAYYRA